MQGRVVLRERVPDIELVLAQEGLQCHHDLDLSSGVSIGQPNRFATLPAAWAQATEAPTPDVSPSNQFLRWAIILRISLPIYPLSGPCGPSGANLRQRGLV